MNHDQETELRTLLSGYCVHVPPKVANGSHNLAVEFKESVKTANKLLNRRARANEQELRSMINKLHTYWT